MVEANVHTNTYKYIKHPYSGGKNGQHKKYLDKPTIQILSMDLQGNVTIQYH